MHREPTKIHSSIVNYIWILPTLKRITEDDFFRADLSAQEIGGLFEAYRSLPNKEQLFEAMYYYLTEWRDEEGAYHLPHAAMLFRGKDVRAIVKVFEVHFKMGLGGLNKLHNPKNATDTEEANRLLGSLQETMVEKHEKLDLRNIHYVEVVRGFSLALQDYCNWNSIELDNADFALWIRLVITFAKFLIAALQAAAQVQAQAAEEKQGDAAPHSQARLAVVGTDHASAPPASMRLVRPLLDGSHAPAPA